MSGVVPSETNPSQLAADSVAESPIEPIPDAEIIRRSYLAHESKVRSLGLLSYLAAALSLTLAVLLATELERRRLLTFRLMPAWWDWAEGGPLILRLIGLAGPLGVLGFGLRRLASWARWATTAAGGLAFASFLAQSLVSFGPATSFVGRPGLIIGNTLGMIASGYVLLVLLSRRSGRVFGQEYRAVIRQTPEIRPFITLVAGVVIATILGLTVVGLIALGVRPILDR